MTNTVIIKTKGMTPADVVSVARFDAKVEISKESLEAMDATRKHIEKLANGDVPVYGISTGFGALANRHIALEDRVQLQKSLIRSHAAGMGEPVEREVVRALMLLRLKTICSGRTGARRHLGRGQARQDALMPGGAGRGPCGAGHRWS
jgi:histidine ammonia-lyase